MSGEEQRGNADEIAIPSDEEMNQNDLEDLLSDVRSKKKVQSCRQSGKVETESRWSPSSRTFVTCEPRSRPRQGSGCCMRRDSSYGIYAVWVPKLSGSLRGMRVGQSSDKRKSNIYERFYFNSRAPIAGLGATFFFLYCCLWQVPGVRNQTFSPRPLFLAGVSQRARRLLVHWLTAQWRNLACYSGVPEGTGRATCGGHSSLQLCFRAARVAGCGQRRRLRHVAETDAGSSQSAEQPRCLGLDAGADTSGGGREVPNCARERAGRNVGMVDLHAKRELAVQGWEGAVTGSRDPQTLHV